MNNRPLPIGIEFYKRIIDDNYYYVDKTLLVKAIIDSNAMISLFTRPRRFGKTLALNMLKVFFEDERDRNGVHIDNSHYFDGKKIAACGEKYTEKMGKFPVISLSLKSAKQPDFDMAYHVLVDTIWREFDRHRYVLESDALSDEEKIKFKNIYAKKADPADYATSLAFLSECLKKYHNRNVIILIDEYDVPLENSYFQGFYDEMINFIRSLFESALKTNDNLEFAVITGCLRISRESIFTGLNNLEVISLLNKNYSEYFGFTQSEAEELLAFYHLENKISELKKWYDGYMFGNTEVYNPWSVINYAKSCVIDPDEFPRPYWSNTSSNSIIKELIEDADFATRKEIENLIAGGTIEKPVHEDITYGDIHESQDNLWNFLFFTGYLKKIDERQVERTIYLKMAIPNEEVASIYENTILTWFDKKIRKTDLSPLMHAIESKDCTAFGDFVSAQLRDTISFFDYAENYYHGFLAGLLKGAGPYELLSNRESGNGRPDIIMKPDTIRKKAFILELKVVKNFRQMDAACDEAIAQAKEKNYCAELEDEGYLDTVIYGICFYKKECVVKVSD